jgi:small conductance mechanosensitive channel
VRAFDGTLWHVRNGEVLRAGNHTQQWARSVAKVEVPVGSDVEAVRAALHKAVERVVNSEEHSPNLLEDPTVRGIDALGEGTYTFTMHARVLPGTDYPINRALLECAREELITAGVLGAAPLG